MRDLTKGSERKLIFSFAVPMLLGNVFQQLYHIIDSVIVGHFLGKQALAAVGASFPIIFLLIALVIGIGSGSTVLISQFYGAKDLDKVKRTIDTVYIFLTIAAVTASVIGIIFCRQIFTLLSLPPELLPQAMLFLRIFLGGMVFAFLFNGTSAILHGLGDSKTPLYFLILSTSLNVLLDLLFIVVFKWGIASVAIATLISQFVALVSIVTYINRKHTIITISLSGMKFDKEIFAKSLKIGLPTGLQQTFVALGMMALIKIVNGFGINVIAAYTVAGRIDSLAAMPAMNFSAALSAFVGQNIGANKQERIKSGLIETLKMSSVIAITVSLVTILLGHQLMHLFTPDDEVARIGHEYLMIVGSFYLVFNAMFIMNGAMRGTGATLVPMFISLISLWLIRIPIALYLSKHFGEKGIWWAIPVAWFCGAIANYIYFRSGKWKKRRSLRIITHPKPLHWNNQLINVYIYFK